jgi:hypothetical protein
VFLRKKHFFPLRVSITEAPNNGIVHIMKKLREHEEWHEQREGDFGDTRLGPRELEELSVLTP